MNRYIPPSPFYTFEPLRHDPLELIPSIQSSQGGDHTEIKLLEDIPSSILELEEGENPIMDPAMMLFLCSVAWKGDGGMPEPLDKAIISAKADINVFLTPSGQQLNENLISELLEYKSINLVCGRYEGYDQRILEIHSDYEISIFQ